MSRPFLLRSREGALLAVRITPKANRSQILGVHGDELKISLNAPPVDGKANKALIALLAKTFLVPKSHIIIQSGTASRSKKILFASHPIEELQPILDKILAV
jgi:uncharacterized protein